MNNGIIQFKKEAINIPNAFPDLVYQETVNGIPRLAGSLILEDKEGFFVDRYSVEIEPTINYPFRFPHVYETGGRLPHNIDWHVFPDGHCCIKSLPEESIICKQGINLKVLIEEQITPYFFNQKYREMHGFYLKERAHGTLGNIEYFKEVFKTNDLLAISKCLHFIKQRREPSRTCKCFCGHKKKYRKCHRDVYRLLNLYTDDELDMYVKMILSTINF